MHDSIFTAEADEMSRAFDPANTDVPTGEPSGSASTGSVNHRLNSDALRAVEGEPAAVGVPATPRRTVSSHSVCPFCGCVNDSSAGACRQCGMENTQATRQATRSKIGPWFVWQLRNPSAPGMNWATLMSLVEKGRITPRSVVRGPTTGQLWRFAARVKGLSREFGTCWHCGTELKKIARLCASCKRLQQPPANPDTLLETPDAPPFKPVINPRPQGAAGLAPEPIRREVPAQEMPRPATFPAPSPVPELNQPSLPVDPLVPVIDMGDELLPLGLEMRTFRLDSPVDPQPPHRGVTGRILIAAALTFAALAPVLYLNPQVRPHYVRWYHQLIGWVKGTGVQSPTPAATPTRDAPELTRTSPTPLWSVPASVPVDRVYPEPVITPKSWPITQPKILEVQVTVGSATESVGKVPPSSAPVIQISPPPLEPQAAERRSWELYKRAIESEQRDDYAEAVKAYEWIIQLRLPEGAGPMDVESRLQWARQSIKRNR